MARVFLIALLSISFLEQAYSKDLNSRFFYMGLNLAGLYGQDHAQPNYANNSAVVDLSELEAFPATGTGLQFGFEILSKLPISFFVTLDYNYIKDSSDSSARRGVITTGATLLRFKQKLRLHEIVAEGGLNINLKYKESILQFFGSFGLGTLFRFERIAYTTDDGTVNDFLRESRSDSLMTRLSGGVRYINQKRYFFETKLSLTSLTMNGQKNTMTTTEGSVFSQTQDDQELADIDDEKEYISLYLGGGYFF